MNALRDLPLVAAAALSGQISAAHVRVFVYVTGFLNTVTGAKLKKVIDSVSAPRDKDDTRTGAQRRVQGLDDLLSAILANGLPDDKGVKPHMSVFVNADTLAAAAEHVKQTTEHPDQRPDPMPPTEPATLAGHGAIGPNLLMYFLCVSEFTAFLMKEPGAHRQAGPERRHREVPAQPPAAAPGGDRPPDRGLRHPRPQPHPPGDPPRHLVGPHRRA
ncbi:MAG: endonuclease [Aeromicrobium sp.]|nr:endonuclease [Aeromicrobium sp.]